MKNIAFKKIEIENGEIISYRVREGTGKKLLLIHGNMNSSVNWDLLMENLKEDYKIYALDLRGFGLSTYKNEISSIKDFAKDVKLFVDSLGIKDFVISGWSAGGAVAMQFVIDYPGLSDKLILLESCSIKGFPIYKRNILGKVQKDKLVQSKEEIIKMIKPLEKMKANNSRWLLKKMLEASLYSKNKPDDERYELYIDEMILQRNLKDINYSLVTFNISNEHNGVVSGTGEVDKISIPTLVVQGDEDKVVTMEMAKVTKEGIGKNAELKIMKGCGHSPLLDDLNELVKIYEEFIDR